MPKVLVLLSDDSAAANSLATSVGDGAKAVRFTEVDLRAVESLDVAELGDYDGVVVVGSSLALPPAVAKLLTSCETAVPPKFTNTVFASAGFDDDVALVRIARLGGIVVTEGRNELNADDQAKVVGKRVAKIAGWVRHALNHERADHQHAH